MKTNKVTRSKTVEFPIDIEQEVSKLAEKDHRSFSAEVVHIVSVVIAEMKAVQP